MTVYFYIEQTEELISLHSTEDILEVPVDARIVSEEDANEIFPRIPDDAGDFDVLTVRHPEYAGTYVRAHYDSDSVAPLDRAVLIRTDAIKHRVLSAIGNRNCNRPWMACGGGIDLVAPFASIYVPLPGSEMQKGSCNEFIFDKRPLLAKNMKSFGSRWPYMSNAEYSALSSIIGPVDVKTVQSMLSSSISQISDTRLPDNLITDTVLTQIVNKIAAFDKSTIVDPEDQRVYKSTYDTLDIKCTDGSVIHIRMDYMLQGYFSVTIHKFPEPVSYVKKGITRYKRRKKTIQLPTERIIYPEKHVLSTGEIVLSPVDNTRRSRRRFLVKLYQLGWYSIRTQIKKELESMFATCGSNNSTPVADKQDLLKDILHFYSNGWIDQEVKDTALASILASDEANKLIDDVVEYENKLQASMTKSAVRKALFKDIRKRLDMQK